MIHNFVAKKVCVAYRGGARAIRGFDFECSGDSLCIVGKSGSGKTTIINALAGLLNYDGEFILDNIPLLKSPKGDRVEAVLEDYCLFPKKTVRENIEYPLKVRGLDISEAEKQIENFGLKEFENVKVKDCKNNLKPYIALSRIFLIKRDLYLFDDILKPLNKEDKEGFLIKLKEIFARIDGFKIYATSDINEAKALSDNIVVIYGGVIEQIGSFTELKDYPLSLEVLKMVEKEENTLEYRGKLLEDNGTLYVDCEDKKINLQKNDINRLIDLRYIGHDVILISRENAEINKLLLFDSTTEKTLLTYNP